MSLSELSPDDLIRRFQQSTEDGDRTSLFEALWLKIDQIVENMIRGRLVRRNVPWSDDDVRQIRLRTRTNVFRRLGGYRGDGLKGWLWKTICSGINDWIRDETSERRLFGVPMTPDTEKELGDGRVPALVVDEFSRRFSDRMAQRLTDAKVYIDGDRWIIESGDRNWVVRQARGRVQVYRKRRMERRESLYQKPDKQEAPGTIIEYLYNKSGQKFDSDRPLHEDIEEEDESRKLEQALAKMKELGPKQAKWAEAVTLHYMKGYNDSQLSKLLHISGTTVNKRLDRGVMLLKYILMDEGVSRRDQL